MAPLAALMLAGCAASLRTSPSPEISTRPPSASPNAPTPELPPEVPRPAPAPREFRLSPATQSLVAQAHTLQGRGDLLGASSTLDRALRIEPSNPLLWMAAPFFDHWNSREGPDALSAYVAERQKAPWERFDSLAVR